MIFKVEGDAFPTSQEDEEARIGSLAYAIKKLGNKIDAAEFVRCLNAICDGGDALSRQTAASHYYREIAERGTGVVLKEMALLAMQLQDAGKTESGERFYSHANHELQSLCREVLETILTECQADFHLTAV